MKGIVYLIRAFAHLRTEFPQLRLEIAGLGSEQAVLEREVRTLGVQDGVTFLGWRADLAPVLAGWDIYVQPSVVEPFGLAALEAMAAGLPVVATTAGGLTELVEDGRTGWLVSAGNPQGLAGRIRELLLDPMQRRAMGEAGHVRARERFSSDRMAAEISEIYESLLAA
jgi:glycosyltransferase involved in cell wall biosynthesis